MDQDELSAALRNQGLIRQARYADRDGTTAKATIKRMRKAGSSGTTQFTCHCKTLQFAHCYVCNDGQHTFSMCSPGHLPQTKHNRHCNGSCSQMRTADDRPGFDQLQGPKAVCG